jgi:hypothetical protein
VKDRPRELRRLRRVAHAARNIGSAIPADDVVAQ